MRFRPAAFSSAACWASSTPLVVSAMSSMPASAVEIADEIGEVRAQQRLAAGEAQLAARRAARTGARAARSPRTTAARSTSGTGSSRGTSPAACSTGSGSCSGPSPRCAGRAAGGPACRAAADARAGDDGVTFRTWVMAALYHHEYNATGGALCERGRPGRQLDEAVGAGQRGEIAGAVGRLGHRPGAAPASTPTCTGMKNASGGFTSKRVARARSSPAAAAAAPIDATSAGEHVARQAHQRRDRVAGQREHRLPAGSDAEPQRLAGPLRDLVKHDAHAQLSEHLRHESNRPIETPPLRISTSCVSRCASQARAQDRGIVGHVIVRRLREAAPPQSGHDCVDVRATDLPVRQIGSPGSTSSLPVEITTMRGVRVTRRVRAPVRREHATSAGPRRMPGCKQLLAPARVGAAAMDVLLETLAPRRMSAARRRPRLRSSRPEPRNRSLRAASRPSSLRCSAQRRATREAGRRPPAFRQCEMRGCPRSYAAKENAMPSIVTRSNGG